MPTIRTLCLQPSRTYVFRSYDRAELDAEYNNRTKVPGAVDILHRWAESGRRVRKDFAVIPHIPYGTHERHRLDCFPAAAPGGPVLIFVHGGYWHTLDKTIAHFLAPTYVRAGVNFVAAGYRLCPEVRVRDAVADVARAVAWVHGNAETEFGGDSSRIFIAGHSAGGHLAAMMCGPRGPGSRVIKGGCSISGLHDLEPIRLCYLNERLLLDAEEVRENSPVALARALPLRAPALPHLLLTVGSEEGPEYLRQCDDLAHALGDAGQPVSVVNSLSADHFTVCEAFSDPEHDVLKAMLRMMGQTRKAPRGIATADQQ